MCILRNNSSCCAHDGEQRNARRRGLAGAGEGAASLLPSALGGERGARCRGAPHRHGVHGDGRGDLRRKFLLLLLLIFVRSRRAEEGKGLESPSSRGNLPACFPPLLPFQPSLGGRSSRSQLSSAEPGLSIPWRVKYGKKKKGDKILKNKRSPGLLRGLLRAGRAASALSRCRPPAGERRPRLRCRCAPLVPGVSPSFPGSRRLSGPAGSPGRAMLGYAGLCWAVPGSSALPPSR